MIQTQHCEYFYIKDGTESLLYSLSTHKKSLTPFYRQAPFLLFNKH